MEKSKNPPVTDATIKSVEDLLVDGEELLLIAQPLKWRMVSQILLNPLFGIPATIIFAGFTIAQVQNLFYMHQPPFIPGLAADMPGVVVIILLIIITLGCIAVTL